MRLDELVVARGLAASRAEAARLILAGRVRLDGAVADKAGRAVRADAGLGLVAAAPYVSRGGEKLAGALDAVDVSPRDRVCLDVGASTGGFTDCLLERGARHVHAVDVGHGQLHPRLRADPRVQVPGAGERPGPGARRPSEASPSLATVDVAFISLARVLPAVAACLAGAGTSREILALVKPQFEVGRGRVGRGGVVRDAAQHREVLRRLSAFAADRGLAPQAIVASPLRGPKGNREFFLHLRPGGPVMPPDRAGGGDRRGDRSRGGRMRRIGVVARVDRADAGTVARELIRWLGARGCQVVVERETGRVVADGAAVVELAALPARVELIVVLGGDGTLLSVARVVHGHDVPILGVNLGGLGFLTATTLEAMYPTLEAVLRGDFAAEERMALAVSLERAGEPLAEYHAMNDVVIAKGGLGRLIDLEVSVDGQTASAYRADGLIIATPTGSTAYNLSAAGPILFPTMDAVVLTPVASHALTNRPIVLPGTARVDVALLRDAPDVALCLDGQPGLAVTRKDVVRVQRSGGRVRLIRDPNKSYFQVLRTKLKWGER